MRPNFKSIMAASAMAATILLGANSGANALTWTLTNVPLTDGGALSGTFTIDQYGYLGSYNLTTTIGGEGFSESYISPAPVSGGVNTTSPPVAGNVLTLFPNDSGYTGELQLTFANSLSTPGINPIVIGNAASFECLGSFSCYLTGQTVVYPWGTFGPTFSLDTRYVGSGDASFAAATSFATPLPSTWLMLLSGFVGLGFFVYRGTKNNSAAIAAA